MRRRRLRTPRARRSGTKKHDWVLLFQTQVPLVVPQTTYTAPNAVLPLQIALLDDQDLQDKQDSLTIVRTVGEIQVMSNMVVTVANPLQIVISVFEGIYIASDSAATTAQFDPTLAGDVDRDNWLWLRTTRHIHDSVGGGVIRETFFNNNDYFAGLSPHLDIRVMRKLTRGTELVYCVKALVPTLNQTGVADGLLMGTVPAGNFTAQAFVMGAIRGLVKF